MYFISLFFACSCGLIRFSKLDKAAKILALLQCFVLFDEIAADYLARKYHNNLTLYSFYSIFEFTILCFYFNNVIDIFKKKKIGTYIAIVGIILGIANIVFLQRPGMFNSYFLLFEGLMVIGMSLFGFFRLLLRYDSLNLFQYAHFWFISILLFFWSVTFLNWGLYDYINKELTLSAYNVDAALDIVSTITYVCFGLAFLLYPKMKNSYE